MIQRPLGEFINKESIGGLMLLAATIIALVVSNSSLFHFYQRILSVHFSISLGSYGLRKPVLLWINDGLMTVFFFVIGLELKRECISGHLKEIHNVILPMMGALGGVIVPVIIFSVINFHHPLHQKGWAIPMATDIAFALGIMSLYSHRISRAMKIFLLTLAIIDDLLAILVIAIFHTEHLSWYSLLIAGICLCLLVAINLGGVKRLTPYLVIGLVLWVCVLKSGVHATLAGVVLAMFIPMEGNQGKPLLKDLEEDLHPMVVYLVLPAFAFANAGIHFESFTWNNIIHSIPLGIVLGLWLGKPIGIVLFTFITQKLTRAKLMMSKLDLAIIGCFAGIGFTMSLFIGSLSFGSNDELLNLARLGILLGSLLSIISASFLTAFHKRDVNDDNTDPDQQTLTG